MIHWLSQSMDTNPIKNVWALMKLRLIGKKIMYKQQLILQFKMNLEEPR